MVMVVGLVRMTGVVGVVRMVGVVMVVRMVEVVGVVMMVALLEEHYFVYSGGLLCAGKRHCPI